MDSFFDILQNAYTTAYTTAYKMSSKDEKFIEPRIYHGGPNFDLSKRWYVYYSYVHPTKLNKDGTPAMERRPPITMGINRKYKTKGERMLHLGIVKEVLHELLKGGFSPNKDKLPFSEQSLNYTAESALDYAYDYRLNTLSQTSIPDYRSRYKQFKKYLEGRNLLHQSILAVSKKTVNEYLNSIIKKSSARNRNNTKTVLSSLFGVLEKQDIIPRNFIEHIDDLKSSSVVHRTYSLNALEGLFAYMKKNDPLLLLFIKVVSYNFLRPIEVCRLKLKDLNIAEKYLYVKAKNKPTKKKIVPDLVINELNGFDFSNQDYFLFTPDKIGGVWDSKETSRRDYWTKRFGKLKKKFNEYLIENGENYQLGEEYTVYSFRHTFITILFRELRKLHTLTETYDKLMLITGHSSLSALKKYLRDIDVELPEDYSGMIVQHLRLVS